MTFYSVTNRRGLAAAMRGGASAIVLLLLVTLSTSNASESWFADAVWYQIFPERFRNGDVSNDPVPASLEGTWPYAVPEGWEVVPWTADWYQLQPWEERHGRGFYYSAQLRRYGGDLQGVLDRLDYLQALGVNALYLNPVFDSASLHKYGASRYHHVDRHFGPDPKGDVALFDREDPGDPATWQWSAADQLFLKLIREVHRRDMRIIIDGVFNHVGIPFWAFQQAKREGPKSLYAKWFDIIRWDDPATAKDEFDYLGWAGVKDLPQFHRDDSGFSPEVKAHFQAVVHRWMDPNGDGDPSDGIDGWRLDVAAEVPIEFWKEFRIWVKAVNPDAYLTGEIWWDDFRNATFKNARPWLNGAFDAVMNYRFGDAVFQFFNQPQPISAEQFDSLLREIRRDFGYRRCLDQQDLFGSHDTSRIGSAVVNPRYRQDHGGGVQQNRDYNVRKPNAREKRRWQQMVAFQFLSPGAPYIYYGDEVGMWGADDPDCRKPMVWEDLRYDPEQAHPFGLQRSVDGVAPDRAMLEFYRQVIRWRKGHAALRRGSFRTLIADGGQGLFAFAREHEGQRAIAVFNVSDREMTLSLDLLGIRSSEKWRGLSFSSEVPGEVIIEPRGFQVFVAGAE